MALINAETNSVNSIPCESDNGGQQASTAVNQQFLSSPYGDIKEVSEP